MQSGSNIDDHDDKRDIETANEGVSTVTSLLQNVRDIRGNLAEELRSLNAERNELIQSRNVGTKRSTKAQKMFECELKRLDVDATILSKGIEIQKHKNLLMMNFLRKVDTREDNEETNKDLGILMCELGSDPKIVQLQEDIISLKEESQELREMSAKKFLKRAKMENLRKNDINDIAQKALQSVVRAVSGTKMKMGSDSRIIEVLEDSKSVESTNIICFISRFYACNEKNANMGVLSAYEGKHLATCKTNHLTCYTTSMLSVRDFISELSAHLVANYDEETDVAEVEVVLEDRIFPQIYTVAKKTVTAPIQDRKAREKCARYHDATQLHFGVPPEYISDELVPYSLPIATLKSIYFSLTPTRKALKIYSAIQEIFLKMEELSGKARPSLEDFLPVWLYCVCKARIYEVRTNVAYIFEYMDQNMLQTDAGYAVSSLDSATTYIMGIEDDQLRNYVRDSSTNPIFVLEQKRFREWSQIERTLEVINENVKISGYRAVCVSEWLWDPSRFHASVAVWTGRAEDVFSVSLACFNSRISPAQRSFIEGIFVYPSSTWMRAEKVKGTSEGGEEFEGSLLILDLPNFTLPSGCGSFTISHDNTARPGSITRGLTAFGNVAEDEEELTLIPISRGSYDEAYSSLRFQLNSLRLNSNTLSIELDDHGKIDEQVGAEIFTIFCNLYQRNQIPTSGSRMLFSIELIDELMCEFVRGVQTMLLVLDFFPLLVERDGEYNMFTRGAVMLFQNRFNTCGYTLIQANSTAKESFDKSKDVITLEEDGYLDVSTFTMLRLAIQQVQSLLVVNGFPNCPADPTVGTQEVEFAGIVKQFQKSCGLFEDGKVGAKTLGMLYRIGEKLHPEILEAFSSTYDDVVREMRSNLRGLPHSVVDGNIRSPQLAYTRTTLLNFENSRTAVISEQVKTSSSLETNETKIVKEITDEIASEELGHHQEKILEIELSEILENTHVDINATELSEMVEYLDLVLEEVLIGLWDFSLIAKLANLIFPDLIFLNSLFKSSVIRREKIGFAAAMSTDRRAANWNIVMNALKLLSINADAYSIGNLAWMLYLEYLISKSPIRRTSSPISDDVAQYLSLLGCTEAVLTVSEGCENMNDIIVSISSSFGKENEISTSSEVVEMAKAQAIPFVGMINEVGRGPFAFILSLICFFNEKSVKLPVMKIPSEYSSISALLNDSVSTRKRNLGEILSGPLSELFFKLLEVNAEAVVNWEEISDMDEENRLDSMMRLANSSGISFPPTLRGKLLSKDASTFKLCVERVFTHRYYADLEGLIGIRSEAELCRWCNERVKPYGLSIKGLKDGRLKTSQYQLALANSLFGCSYDLRDVSIGATDIQRIENASRFCTLLWSLGVSHFANPQSIVEMNQFMLLHIVVSMIRSPLRE